MGPLLRHWHGSKPNSYCLNSTARFVFWESLKLWSMSFSYFSLVISVGIIPSQSDPKTSLPPKQQLIHLLCCLRERDLFDSPYSFSPASQQEYGELVSQPPTSQGLLISGLMMGTSCTDYLQLNGLIKVRAEVLLILIMTSLF